MLIEEVELVNDGTICEYCYGTGYHSSPTQEELSGSKPLESLEPVICPYCFGNGHKLDK